MVAGASYGGLAAAYTALSNPDIFGAVLSQSGSYWWWPGYQDTEGDNILSSNAGWVAHEFSKAPKMALRFYMDVGAWEGILMLLPNRTFRDVLVARGYDVTYREFVGGHDFVAWRGTFVDGLIALSGGSQR